MSLTLFLLLISIGFIALFTTLLKLKRIRNLVYFALVALLILFDFAVLSLDKIYFLHNAQDDAFIEKLAEKERAINEQLVLYRELTSIQLDMALAVMTDNAVNDSEAEIRQKIATRDKLVNQMQLLEFDEAKIQHVQEQINLAVHRYLMEQLNQTVIKALGHRTYGEFVRSRPRHEWTDTLFVKELEEFLKKHSLQNEEIKQRLQLLKVFDSSGVLL